MTQRKINYRVEGVNWQDHQQTLRQIRQQVFIEEQGVSVEDEWDNHDLGAWHFLLHNDLQAIGCARVVHELSDTNPALHIGRVAVLKPFRAQRAGHSLMKTVIRTCLKHHPNARLYLHAQTTVTGFYTRLGFRTEGEVFMDAGIPHIAMTYYE
ncbi:MAG TPA: GNAT family N-acetyltransferase [Cellvibrionaceae bacterium]